MRTRQEGSVSNTWAERRGGGGWEAVWAQLEGSGARDHTRCRPQGAQRPLTSVRPAVALQFCLKGLGKVQLPRPADITAARQPAGRAVVSGVAGGVGTQAGQTLHAVRCGAVQCQSLVARIAALTLAGLLRGHGVRPEAALLAGHHLGLRREGWEAGPGDVSAQQG